MDSNVKKMPLVVSFVALLAIGCGERRLGPVDSADVRQSRPPSAVESSTIPAAAPDLGVGDADRTVSQERPEDRHDAPVEEEHVNGVTPGDIPDVEERDAILERVNLGLGPPENGGDRVGTGPAPGTESEKGTKVP